MGADKFWCVVTFYHSEYSVCIDVYMNWIKGFGTKRFSNDLGIGFLIFTLRIHVGTTRRRNGLSRDPPTPVLRQKADNLRDIVQSSGSVA